jgi:arylsulfatase A-like enzyme
MNKYIFILFTFVLAVGCQQKEKTESTRPNILFIVSDDLNDWIGCLGGHPQVKTPNIDELAKRGVVFNNAHCAAPLCGPSRAAFMTGLQSYSSGLYNNGSRVQHRDDLMTMPQYFRNEGYFVAGAGKLFHSRNDYTRGLFDEYAEAGPGVSGGPFVDGEINSELQNPSHKVDRGEGKLKADLPLNGMPSDRPYNRYNTFDWGPVDVSDDEMVDGYVTNYIVDKLKQKYDKPFFLGAGFFRPHQPLFAPRKYHEMYPVELVILPEIIENDLSDVAQTAKDFGRLAATSGTHKTVQKYGQRKSAVSSYLACVSFVDAQIGRILNALEESEYAENTIIVFLGDNGWHLGEKEHWGKWTGWEQASRVPLIVVPPKSWKSTGNKQEATTVSLIDVFPTLIEMTESKGKIQLDGKNIVPLLKGEKLETNKNLVITTFGYGNNTVITPEWHYIHYFDGTEELYNLQRDEKEWTNLIHNKEYESIVLELKQNLPAYSEVEYFVRWGKWKAVLTKDVSKTELYNISARSGIMDKDNLASENKDVLNSIRKLIEEKGSKVKYVLIKE